MIGYPYIQQLFQTILNNSKVIAGRFYVCPKWGSELANPNIDEALAIGQAKSQKYPAAMLMPPPKTGYFQYQATDKVGIVTMDCYTIQILFVAGSTLTGENQQMQTTTIGTSTHTIPDTWHDMDRCAQNFCVTLLQVLEPLGGNVIFVDDADAKPKIKLVTNISGDKVSGVMLSFKLLINSGCTNEDYTTIPTAPPLTDIHPLHGM